MLFVIFINDLLDVVTNTARIFADDTKLFGKVGTVDYRTPMQCDIDNLSKWSEEWLLKFNTSKCKVMHPGHNKTRSSYQMKDNEGIYQTLQESDVEKDLGLHFDNRLSFHEHVNQAVSKANRTLGLLKRTFVVRDNMVIKKL